MVKDTLTGVYAFSLKGLSERKTAESVLKGQIQHPHDVSSVGNRLGLTRPTVKRLVGHEQDSP